MYFGIPYRRKVWRISSSQRFTSKPYISWRWHFSISIKRPVWIYSSWSRRHFLTGLKYFNMDIFHCRIHTSRHVIPITFSEHRVLTLLFWKTPRFGRKRLAMYQISPNSQNFCPIRYTKKALIKRLYKYLSPKYRFCYMIRQGNQLAKYQRIRWNLSQLAISQYARGRGRRGLYLSY